MKEEHNEITYNKLKTFLRAIDRCLKIYAVSKDRSLIKGKKDEKLK